MKVLKDKKIIALSGMRGSGKSTIGKILAKMIGWEFVDIDNMIEKQENKKVAEIVEVSGWKKFRSLEHEATKKILKKEKIILGLGGGTIIQDENYEILKEKAYIIFLYCEPFAAAKRIAGNKNRPSLKGNKSFLEELEEVWSDRREKYLKRCDISIETSIAMNKRDLEKYLLAKVSYLFR